MWLRRTKQFRTSPLRPALLPQLNGSQAQVAGFDLAALQSAHVVMIGGGGIGATVAPALVKKGLGHLTLIDDDRVELKNLTRMPYSRHDIGRLKTECLARQLARDGLFPTTITSIPRRFQELIEDGYAFAPIAAIICGVDNNPTRRAVTGYALARDIPVIHTAVSRAGGELYVMVQEPGRACWGCAFPHYVNNESYPCNLPGIIDVLQAAAALIIYGLDSLLAGRHRTWNVRHQYLDGSLPDVARRIERRPDCVLCGQPHARCEA